MRIVKLLACIGAIAALAGCAHPIIITPDVTKIERGASDRPVKQNVAYYIADDVLSKEVTTPGGGGDKVSYLPYRDIETAFYKMLSNVYQNVTKLKSPTDAEAISKNNIHYVITPELVTNSSSPSPLTWPPTNFEVALTCNIRDVASNVLVTRKVTGQGHAEWDEFKKDFALSGKRATQDALVKMQRELMETGALNVASAPATNVAATPIVVATTAATVAATAGVANMPVAASQKPATRHSTAPSASASNVFLPAEPAVTESSVSPAILQKVDFKLGRSSVTVERIAHKASCVGGKGAALITTSGPVEIYRMDCGDGRTFMARCELRECRAMPPNP